MRASGSLSLDVLVGAEDLISHCLHGALPTPAISHQRTGDPPAQALWLGPQAYPPPHTCQDSTAKSGNLGPMPTETQMPRLSPTDLPEEQTSCPHHTPRVSHSVSQTPRKGGEVLLLSPQRTQEEGSPFGLLSPQAPAPTLTHKARHLLGW